LYEKVFFIYRRYFPFYIEQQTEAEKQNTADIGFDPGTKTIYVPGCWKNSVVAYMVSEE
jgi:hypothetical protein